MKRLALLLAVILVISMPISALAAPWSIMSKPDISFNGAVATCKATVLGNTPSEYLVANLR